MYMKIPLIELESEAFIVIVQEYYSSLEVLLQIQIKMYKWSK